MQEEVKKNVNLTAAISCASQNRFMMVDNGDLSMKGNKIAILV